MKNIKMIIEYDGSRYLGWQKLGDTEKTIQGKIERILTNIIGSDIEIVGSGRTDAGTHARGQVANFKTGADVNLMQLQAQLLRYLPQDIIVKNLVEVPERFHARYNATGKKYSYYVWNQLIPSAFNRHYSFYYPETLHMDKMNQACERLLGTHDFLGFSALKKTKKSTIRTLKECSIQSEGDCLHFTVVGDGFLHKMVRIIVGTVLAIGDGSKEIDCIDEIFSSKVRKYAGETVPAQGLFLDEVYYDAKQG